MTLCGLNDGLIGWNLFHRPEFALHAVPVQQPC
jgi:hypothetical protein